MPESCVLSQRPQRLGNQLLHQIEHCIFLIILSPLASCIQLNSGRKILEAIISNVAHGIEEFIVLSLSSKKFTVGDMKTIMAYT